jgi:hypothetical protein
VKDADVPLFELAQEQLGEGVSSIFAEFLRDRVANLTPEEGRIIALLNQIKDNRETAKKDRGCRSSLTANTPKRKSMQTRL